MFLTEDCKVMNYASRYKKAETLQSESDVHLILGLTVNQFKF